MERFFGLLTQKQYERGRRLFRAGEIQWIFHQLSFCLNQGDSLGVIGNNGVGKSTLLRLMGAIIDFAELGKHLEKPVSTYSAGMKARLNFSRAAMLDADVLLIDEVLSVGDKNFRGKCDELMRKRINSEQTVVYVSHNEKSVVQLCDQVLWIDQGAARALGPAEKIVEQYLAS